MKDLYTLFNDNIELASKLASKHDYAEKLPKEEFEQNVLIALWYLCTQYNSEKGSMQAFMFKYLYQHITRVCDDDSNKEELIDVDYAYSPANEAITDIMIDEVCEYLSNRRDFNSKYTILLVPFYVEDIRAGYKVKTFRDMAKSIGCSVDSALQGYNKIRRIVRHYTQCAK